MKRLAWCIAASLVLASVANANPRTFMGFRLLMLDEHLARWDTNEGGRRLPVTYAFADQTMNFPGARNCAGIVPAQRLLQRSRIAKSSFEREVAAAFAMWQRVADITFVRTFDAGRADIVIGAQAAPVGRAFTNVALRDGGTAGSKVIGKSLICLNPEQRWKIGFDGDLDVYDVRYTVAHEVGHAIGLDHPSPAGQLMSYKYKEGFAELQTGDVAGAVALYGGHDVAVSAGDDARGAAPAGSREWPFALGLGGAMRGGAR